MLSRFALGRELVEAAALGPEVGGFACERGQGVVGQPEEEWVRHLLAEEFAVEVERREERRVSLARRDRMLKAVDEDCELAAALFRGSLARRRVLVARVLLLREAVAEDGKEVCDGFAQLDFDDANLERFERRSSQSAARRRRCAFVLLLAKPSQKPSA